MTDYHAICLLRVTLLESYEYIQIMSLVLALNDYSRYKSSLVSSPVYDDRTNLQYRFLFSKRWIQP